MPYKDRGDRFTAYYGVPSGTPSGYLNGVHWEHSVDCGTYTKNNETFILRCIHFFKDFGETFGDPAGSHGEAFDYSLLAVDELGADPLVQALVMDAPAAFLRSVVEASEGLHPVAKGLILQDLDGGLSGAQIAENRAALLDPKFLGFTFGDVLSVIPREAREYDTGMTMSVFTEEGGELIETGVEKVMASTIYPCSMETW